MHAHTHTAAHTVVLFKTGCKMPSEHHSTRGSHLQESAAHSTLSYSCRGGRSLQKHSPLAVELQDPSGRVGLNYFSDVWSPLGFPSCCWGVIWQQQQLLLSSCQLLWFSRQDRKRCLWCCCSCKHSRKIYRTLTKHAGNTAGKFLKLQRQLYVVVVSGCLTVAILVLYVCESTAFWGH